MMTPAERRKRNRRIKRKKRIIRTLKFLIIVGAIYAFIFCTPFFKVKTVLVEGTEVTSAQTVIEASGIVSGEHILKVDTKSARTGTEMLAYVKSAEVKRVFPNKIKIIVTEGKVCANIALAEGFAAIDETGKVMEIVDVPKVSPAVYGLTVKKSEVGEKITIDEQGQLDVILLYRNHLNKQALSVPYVSITNSEGNTLVEFENGIQAFFGNSKDSEYKVAAFAESLRSAGDIDSGYFDVSVPERIVYSKLTPAEEEALKKAAEEAAAEEDESSEEESVEEETEEE